MKNSKFSLLAILMVTVALALSACGGKSDADIGREATERVHKVAGAEGVAVAVKDGVATLTGTVTSNAARTGAETAAKGEGVTSVTNNIQLNSGAAAPPTMMNTPSVTNPITTTNMSNARTGNARGMGANGNQR